MAVDTSPQSERPGATETSPLLGRQLRVADDDEGSSGPQSDPASSSYSSVSSSPNTTSPHDGGDQEANDRRDHATTREGLPEMAKRLHILLPAMGIGMFLCALDQLLVVATYAKISSDLQALNRVGWVSTA